MFLVERPTLFPSVGLRGLTSPRGFVDTGIDMAVGGRIYLEEHTANDAVVLFGGLPKADVEKLHERLAAQHQLISDQQAELARLRPIANAVREAAVA